MSHDTAKLPRGILGGHIDRLLRMREELGALLHTIASEREDTGRLDEGAAEVAAVGDALKANERHLVQLLAEQAEELGARLEERTQSARSEALELLDQASLAILAFSELTALQRWIENPLQSNGDALRPFVVRALHVQACRPKSSELLTVAGVIDILGERLEEGGVDVGQRDPSLRETARERR
jgi:uncharacterized membrane protein